MLGCFYWSVSLPVDIGQGRLCWVVFAGQASLLCLFFFSVGVFLIELAFVLLSVLWFLFLVSLAGVECFCVVGWRY